MSEQYGKYELLKKLATGGMAQIYLARLRGVEGFERMCVVKRILPHLAENDDFVKMFLHEARIAARLNHPNIVQVYDLGQQDDSFFIAMEFIHGEDLRRIWKRAEQLGQEVPVPVVTRVIADAAAGLDYAHKKVDPDVGPLHIVHRDISPQNILVSFEGSVKVVDFGIAKAADADMNTRSGVLKGKYSYMSPEQAAGSRSVDHRTDLFALGVVLYELLTGTRLFKRSNDIQTLNAVMDCNFAPPSEVNARVPKDLDPIVMKALAKLPEDRFADGREMQLALETWLIEQRQPASTAHVAAYMRELYADRLAAEARAGQMLVEELPEVRSGEEEVSPKRRSPSNRSARPTTSASPKPDRLDRSGAHSNAAAQSEAPEATTSLRPEKEKDKEREKLPRPPSRSMRAPTASVRGANPSPITELPPETSPRVTEVSVQAQNGRKAGPIAVAIAVVIAVAAALVWALRPDVPATLATVRVESDPSGATVVFNGKTVSGHTPLVLPQVPPGNYSLIVGKERYRDATLTVAIPGTGDLTLPLVRLDPIAPPVAQVDAGAASPAAEWVSLTVETIPAGAQLVIDELPRGVSPAVVKVPKGRSVQVRAELSGYQQAVRQISVGEGTEQREAIALEKKVATAVVKPPDSRDSREVKDSRDVRDSRDVKDLKDARDARVNPPAERVTGTVRFVITPVGTWAEVSCGSYNFGSTPFPDKQLPAGTYDCTFTHPELGTRREKIEIRPNEVAKVTVKFN